MYHNGTDIIRVSFERSDLLRGVIVVDSDLEIVRATDDPILAGNKSACPHGNICELEGLDDGLCFVGPYVDVAAVEGGEDP